MTGDGVELLSLVGAFAEPGARPDAAARLARFLGGDAAVLFAPDPELGVLLPAPGLRQTLHGAAEWRAFLQRCVDDGEHAGTLPGAGGPVAARGCAAGDGVVLVVTGASVSAAALAALRPVLPLLGAAFGAERRVDAAEVRARSADEALGRSGVLTHALQQMRERLEGALTDAEKARAEARARAQHAEALAEELQVQAGHLEEQATELEMLNAELAERTGDAERARAAADAANRAKSEFLANMSHELRTPINAVLGYGELLEMEIAGPITEGQRVHLERIRSSGRHLLTLINDILDLAKVEAGQLTVQHNRETLESVVREALTIVEGQYTERGVALRNACDDLDVPYVGDLDRVRQILLNLLSNAAKFTEPGGSVTLRCGTTATPDAEAEVSGTGRWTFAAVEDTGIGIGEEQARTVFQPFVQVESGRTRTQGGTGLGLTISRQLARLMGGDLTLRSEVGKGSCFTLWLPADAVIEGTLDPSIRIR
jgi:signal transduction histidine kinase